MSGKTPVINIKDGTVNGEPVARNCKNCMKMPVCWLLLSVKNAIANHKNATDVLMFEAERLGEICDQYGYIPIMVSKAGEL